MAGRPATRRQRPAACSSTSRRRRAAWHGSPNNRAPASWRPSGRSSRRASRPAPTRRRSARSIAATTAAIARPASAAASNHLGGEHHQRRCSKQACDFVEVCAAGAPCRTPGARCAGGECRAIASVICAGAPCAGPERMCCTSDKLDDYACRPAAACDPFFPRIECTGPRDCPADQDCEITQGNRSQCRGGPHDIALTGVACEVDRDCARYTCPGGARCADTPAGGHGPPGVTRSCVCR